MLKCKICGCEFNDVKERHYISRNNGKVGLAAAFGSNPEDILYDTFDCPACGCQMTAQERKRAFVLIEKNENLRQQEGQMKSWIDSRL